MLLTFANVERRLDPASQKPTAAQLSSALALLCSCSALALFFPGSALALLVLRSARLRFPSVCPSVCRGVGQSSVRSSLLKPCALQMLLMLLLLFLPFFALVPLIFFLQLSVLFDCRTRRTQTRIPAVAPAPIASTFGR